MIKKGIILILFIAGILKTNAQQKEIEITYIANAGFLLETASKKVIIDALFNQGYGNGLIPSDSIVSNIINQVSPFNKTNLMLITHDHGDHFNASMVASYLINCSDNILIAPPKVVNEIMKHPDYKKFENQIVHLDKINQKKNDTTVQGIRVQAFFIQHDSRPQNENVGYLIEIDKLKVFHSGDYNGSEINEFAKLHLENENIDLGLLNSYGFWYTKEERDFTEKYIKPKEIILTHIPPAEVNEFKDFVNTINDFIDITVFESSMKKKSFLFNGE